MKDKSGETERTFETTALGKSALKYLASKELEKDKPDFCPRCGGEMVEKEVTMHFNIPDKPEKEDTEVPTHAVTQDGVGLTSSESLSKENIDWENRVGVPKCPDCRKGSNVRLYTKEWIMIGNEEVCPWICDECNIIWYRDEDIINAKKLETEKDIQSVSGVSGNCSKTGVQIPNVKRDTIGSSEISSLKRWDESHKK